MEEWINWEDHPVPEDIRGILIKYEDGIFSDRYDETGKRKYREEKKILGWKFMERHDPSKKSIQCYCNKKIDELLPPLEERWKNVPIDVNLKDDK